MSRPSAFEFSTPRIVAVLSIAWLLTLTALFQVTVADAWGPLAPAVDGRPRIAPAAHRVVARICSVGGACTEVTAVVTVATSPTAPPARGAIDRKQSLIDLLLLALRMLISP